MADLERVAGYRSEPLLSGEAVMCLSIMAKVKGYLLEFPGRSLDTTLEKLAPITIYCMAYRFKELNDVWSRRINDAKFSDTEQRRAAVKMFPWLVRKSLDRPSRAAIVAGLIPHHLKALPKGLCSGIGSRVARGLGAKWCPRLLRHTPHESLKRMRGTGVDRDREVANTYTSERLPVDRDSVGVTVYLVDDFCTRGATMVDATRAIVESNPELDIEIVGLALGKADSYEYWEGRRDNSHMTKMHEKAWEFYGGT